MNPIVNTFYIYDQFCKSLSGLLKDTGSVSAQEQECWWIAYVAGEYVMNFTDRTKLGYANDFPQILNAVTVSTMKRHCWTSLMGCEELAWFHI